MLYMGYIKKILIVDDSDIDREVLRNMLDEEFEVVEVNNGYSALDVILKKGERFDAVLLDVSMPFCDGINVLRILRENNMDVQIFMVTVEATKENIEKASRYDIADFIKKPFDKNEVLKRLRNKLNIEEKVKLERADIDEIKMYISDLEYIYERYLTVTRQDKKKDARRAYFMKVMLKKASERKIGIGKLDGLQMEMICKATYLCNIGNMLLQNMPIDTSLTDGNKESDIYRQHPVSGALLVRLNHSRYCRRFVDLCSEICLHHHERLDGNGFPHGSRNNSIYAQICGLLEKFEELFSGYSKHTPAQFDSVVNQLESDSGFVDSKVFLLLKESKAEIVQYYSIK